jgi:hypothetical protein
LCGYAVDVVRSCYASKWRFPFSGEIGGFYYFSPPGTPFYEDWHFFGSRNWHNGDGTEWPPFGELEGVRQRWVNGASPFPINPDTVISGDRRCVDGSAPGDSTVPMQRGLPVACWTHSVSFPDAAGGGEGDGEGLVSLGFLAPARGGAEGDGSASASETFNPAASGGGKGDGSSSSSETFNPAASGGGKGDGSSSSSETFNPAASGGGKGDGSSSASETFNPAASGGGQGDGSAAATSVSTRWFANQVVAVGGCTTTGTLCQTATTSGGLSKTFSTSSTSFVEVAAWDALEAHSHTGQISQSLDVTALGPFAEFRFRAQAIDPTGACSVVASSAYSITFGTIGIATAINNLTWGGLSGKLRLSLELRRVNAGSTSITIKDTGNSWFQRIT